jgi:hypothetical protein
MGAGLFGALGAIGDIGSQAAEGQQLAHDEIVRRLAFKQSQETATLNQQRIRQQIAQNAQNMKQGQQPIPLGTSYVAGDGKTYQRFQSPVDGKVTLQELPGGAPETDQQKAFRGLTTIGLSPEEAAQAVVSKYQGKEATISVNQPGVDSPTGAWLIVKDKYTGQELWRTPVAPSRTTLPQETDRDTTDPVSGLTTHSRSIRRPLFPGAPGTGTPQTPLGAIRGAVGLPAAAAPQGGQPAPQGVRVSRPTATPGNRVSGPTQPAAQGTIAVGPYKGIQLTEDGRAVIPPRPGITDSVRQAAQDILDGRDTTKIPAKLRFLGESVAKAYGWKGQGSLTPAQQMQIEQVDNALGTISQPAYLKLFDSTATRLRMSLLPLDPSTEGGPKALAAAINRGTISPEAAQFLDDLTRLRGVITGIRSFTGANNSNATADRLLAELPNFSNTTNSKDALYKIGRLRTELKIIKRLGYFLPDSAAPTGAQPGTGAPSSEDPLGLNLAPAGR